MIEALRMLHCGGGRREKKIVDDLLFGGWTDLLREVVEPLKAKYPFKHWKTGQSDFRARDLIQNIDFSICINQHDYASNVKPAVISI